MNEGKSKEFLIYVDDLTGIYNRRYLKEKGREIEVFQKKNIPFSLAMVDIDHFKEINDVHGHIKGDEVIREFSHFLKATLRASDIVVRYGGDEFVSVMPDTRRQEAEQIYTRIMKRCRTKDFGGLSITISAGIASYPNDGKGFEELLKIADASLYNAKRNGRDRIGGIGKKRMVIPSKLFIGRKEEKEILRNFLAKNNRGVKVAIIKGNVGIGKTRLVKEVVSNILGREILWSDCLALFEEMPYYAIREMIKYKMNRRGKQIIDNIPLSYRIEIGKLIPEIMEEIRKDVANIGKVLDKYRLYESVKRIVELGEKKKVIVIDNLQWADKGTIEILKYLLRSLRTNPVTFLFTYRQEEKTGFLEDYTSYISRETEVKEIGLEPFSYTQVKEMVRSIIGEEPAETLVKYIEHGSGGNPFYIEEIIKGLNENRYLTIAEDRWEFEIPERELIPKSIADITERKYQALSKEGKEILEIASVLGRFDVDIIKEITSYNEGHIIGLLESIRRLGLMKVRAEKIEFQEEISRNVIYKRNVGNIKGKMLHKKVAETLEKQYKGKEIEAIDELAFHYYRSLQKEKGVKYCLEAGNRAKEKYANSSAIEYYTWAEELLRDAKEEEKIKMKIDCLVKRADVLSLIGDNKGAIKDLDTGIKNAIEIGDKKRKADVVLKKATLYLFTSRYQDAINEASVSIKMYKTIGDETGVANALNVMGNAHWYLGENDKALKKYEEVLKIVTDIKDKHFEARVLNNIGNIYKELSDYNKALKNFEYSLKIMRDMGDRCNEIIALNNIGLIYDNLGNKDSSLKFYRDALKIARNIGDKYGEALVSYNTGTIYSTLGDYESALKTYEDALKIARDIGDKDMEAGALKSIGNIYVRWGDNDKAFEHLKESLRIAEGIKSSEEVITNLLSQSDLYLTINKPKKSKEFIDRAHKMAKGSKEMLRGILSHLCKYYLQKKNLKEFEKTMKELKGLSEGINLRSFEAIINLLLGRYYTETKDYKKANEHFNKALIVFVELKERLNIGTVYYYMGKMELARGKKPECKKHLAKSLKIFSSLGVKGWEEKVEKLQQKVK